MLKHFIIYIVFLHIVYSTLLFLTVSMFAPIRARAGNDLRGPFGFSNDYYYYY